MKMSYGCSIFAPNNSFSFLYFVFIFLSFFLSFGEVIQSFGFSFKQQTEETKKNFDKAMVDSFWYRPFELNLYRLYWCALKPINLNQYYKQKWHLTVTKIEHHKSNKKYIWRRRRRRKRNLRWEIDEEVERWKKRKCKIMKNVYMSESDYFYRNYGGFTATNPFAYPIR